ncbi:MAG: hypothetical protein KF774_09630 [Planctomyces sp.]|nr:hypothetical protein [Planctomyces sp.]
MRAMRQGVLRIVGWSALSAVWIGIAYWRSVVPVPLSPTWSLTLEADQFGLGWTADGDFAVGKRTENGRWVRGPLEFLRGGDGEAFREILDSGDEVLRTHLGVRSVLVVRRGGQHFAVDTVTGQVLDELPLKGEMGWALAADGERKLAYLDGETLRMRDLDAREELWASEGHQFGAIPATREFVIGVPNPPSDGGAMSNRHVILNAHTGQPDPRFEDLQGTLYATPSPDRKWLAVKTVSDFRVYDGTTGELRRRVPAHPDERHTFSPDGRELFASYLCKNQKIVTARWSIETGELLAPAPMEGLSEGAAARVFSSDGRHVLESRALKWSERNRILVWLESLGFRIPNGRADSAEVVHLADVNTSRRLGWVVGGHGFVWHPDGASFRLEESGRWVRVYRVPPERDWVRLFHWSVWPLAGFWLAVQLVSRSWSWLRSRRGWRQLENAAS